jgi:hypothetical protein
MSEVPRGYMGNEVRWRPSSRGNWYTKDLNRKTVTTVFERPNGDGYSFVSNSEFSPEVYETVQEAQEAAEEYFGK